MSLGQSLLPEFDHEMAGTRKTLERVPEGKLGWRPHAKSMTLGGLASHLANVPSWIGYTVGRDSLDLAPVGPPPLRQLGVYLRLLDVPVPGLYGPSADEP